MVRIGFVGVWHVHTKDYYRQLKACEGADIRAVWDEDPTTGREWAREHGVEFVESYDALLAREDIDAIVCVSPTTRHGDLLSKAAEAGKHIFTEKLLATTTADGERICKAVEKAGVICTVSLPLLANGKILYAKKLIEDGALGRVTGARFRRSHGGVSDHWLPGSWFDVSLSGGGALMDLGAHPVYVLSYLLGAPKRVSSLMTEIFGTGTDENAVALVEYENGVIGMCETAFVTYGVPDMLEVYGTDGSLFIHGDDIRVATKAIGALGAAQVTPRRLPDDLAQPVIRFVEAIEAGGPAPKHLGARDALVMTRIVEAAYGSDKAGQTIKL